MMKSETIFFRNEKLLLLFTDINVLNVPVLKLFYWIKQLINNLAIFILQIDVFI